MKVVFLDIDGVLNSYDFIVKNHNNILNYYKNNKYDPNDMEQAADIQLMTIDMEKFNMLRDAVNKIGAYVVIISSWKINREYKQIKERFINMGLPVIGETKDRNIGRGNGIKNYVLENKVDRYVVIDDNIFSDYDEEIIKRFIKTDSYDGGLKRKHIDMLINMLGNDNVRKK